MSGWDIAFWICIVAIIYSLVRPGSPALAAVKAIGTLSEGLVGTATGYSFL